MLNENLSKVRKERGLTQEALAIKLNVVRQTVSKWEKGIAVPDADTLCKIADALEVNVSTLLGKSEYDEQQDSKTIAKVLAQINEQLAVRNRHALIVWKTLCIVSVIVIGVLLGYSRWQISNKDSKFLIPDVIEVSDVNFVCNGNELNCFFVPSVGNKKISYIVTLSLTDKSIDAVTTNAQYENGICMASFDKNKLYTDLEYYAVISINYNGEIRNVTLASGLCINETDCTWNH